MFRSLVRLKRNGINSRSENLRRMLKIIPDVAEHFSSIEMALSRL
jgi:hypothetical protein